jgi:hypothetical protein
MKYENEKEKSDYDYVKIYMSRDLKSTLYTSGRVFGLT